MCHMWVAAVQMPSEAGEEVGFMRSGSSSAKHHIVLQAYRFSLHQPPETTEIFSKMQREEFKKMNGKKASEVHSFQQQTQISKVSLSLISKGRVTGPKQSTTIFDINVYRIYTDTNTYLKNLPTLS